MNIPFYVPVMPVLPADMEGIRHASRDAQRRTRPLFVIVEPRTRNSDPEGDFVLRAANLIVETWRLKGAPFVELYDMPSGATDDWWSSDHPLVLLHAYLRNRGIEAIPVTATDRSGGYHDAFVKAAKIGKVGIAIRLYEDDLEIPAATIEKISSISADAKCGNKDVDLIIDLKRILIYRIPALRAQVLDFLAALDRTEPYRSVTLVGTSLPLNLNGVPENEDRDFPRLELRLWREVRTASGQLFPLGLGDYGTVKPEYDDRKKGFAHINGKLLYTTAESTRVLRGQSRKKEKLEFQYPKLARRLALSDVFCKAPFSWGDARISAFAKQVQAAGQPATWIAIATSHHIELVSTQVEREQTVPAYT